MSSFTDPIRVYTGPHRELAENDIPLSQLKNPTLTALVREKTGSFPNRLYMLMHIHTQATTDRHRHYWVLIFGHAMHERNTPFDDDEISVNVVDVTAAYHRGVEVLESKVAQVARTSANVLTSFQYGRIYQAADELARTGNGSVLGPLALKMLRSKVETMGMSI